MKLSQKGHVMSNAKVVTLETLSVRIAELESTITELKVRNRGPKSTRSMTADHAHLVKFGKLRDLAHMKAAKELGLSYGQVYSARGGYTFNHVKSS